MQSPTLKDADIGVTTSKGDELLTGTLASQAQIDEAFKVAQASDGAHTVHNELVVRK